MLIYVHKPTTARVNYGRLINIDHIQRVDPHFWTFRNYGAPGCKITFANGEKMVVTESVQEIFKDATEAK